MIATRFLVVVARIPIAVGVATAEIDAELISHVVRGW